MNSIGVVAVFAAAGLMFTTSALTSQGAQLRSERADLASLIQAESERADTRLERVRKLEAEIQRDTAAGGSAALESVQKQAKDLEVAAGLRGVKGPGLVVTLDDAPDDVPVLPDASPDDLVVHQQDVQAVVNALWAGGAEAMMLQDQRVISTSAVRCVGNTLILQGRVYSPPYVITAVGDVGRMRSTLDSSPEVAFYLEFVNRYNLGWQVRAQQQVELPAFDGSITLQHASPPAKKAADTPEDGTTPTAQSGAG